ncbi:MAG: T9SS type A sorting domain-containing protein [Bacteroidetes bacterium]|nr:T9SS type A sorting domain-containing protein [Bacteroidota bacterium]
MRRINSLLTLILFVLVISFSANSQVLDLDINGLEDLGTNYQYEGWLIVGGLPVTTGTFTVDAGGVLDQTIFSVNLSDLINATTFVLTIEPIPDPDPNPSSTHILSGDFTDFDAPLSVGHPAALGDDYSSVDGKYILATPTNGDNTDELSGIWFLDLSGGSPAVGLTLPTLPAGWKYEGWAVISGMPVTTGTFMAVDMVDEADPFSGNDPGPPFPGEDFLVNAPSGLSFPTDLSGMTAVISIEPDPDNSTAPFLLKPLVGGIPSNAMDHVTYMMDSNVANSFPTGTAVRSKIVSVESSNFITDYVLEQNYPNPFNPSTTIKFGLPEKSNVVITVYNSLGAEVATLVNEVREAGSYEIKFNANNFSSGIYYYKITSGNFVETKKMILLK